MGSLGHREAVRGSARLDRLYKALSTGMHVWGQGQEEPGGEEREPKRTQEVPGEARAPSGGQGQET